MIKHSDNLWREELYSFPPKSFKEIQNIDTFDITYLPVYRVERYNHLSAFLVIRCKSLETFQVSWQYLLNRFYFNGNSAVTYHGIYLLSCIGSPIT